MASQDFYRQLKGYGLTTAHILYRRPDHPWLLQSYVWQSIFARTFPCSTAFLVSGARSSKLRCIP